MTGLEIPGGLLVAAALRAGYVLRQRRRKRAYARIATALRVEMGRRS